MVGTHAHEHAHEEQHTTTPVHCQPVSSAKRASPLMHTGDKRASPLVHTQELPSRLCTCVLHGHGYVGPSHPRGGARENTGDGDMLCLRRGRWRYARDKAAQTWDKATQTWQKDLLTASQHTLRAHLKALSFEPSSRCKQVQEDQEVKGGRSRERKSE